MEHFVDRNGTTILKGYTVSVEEPGQEDNWNYSFQGVVVNLTDEGYIIVEDQEGDCFHVEPWQIEIQE